MNFLFKKIGGMVGLERAYDFYELVNTTNNVNRLATLEYEENGLRFEHMHNKMECMWESLHPLAPGEISCDLGDYDFGFYQR